MSDLKIYASLVPWSRAVDFLVRETIAPGVHSLGTKIEMIQETPEITGLSTDPTFRLSLESAQLLMDELWQCGLRPAEGSGSVGQLAATQKHLEDMRRLVFDSRKVSSE